MNTQTHHVSNELILKTLATINDLSLLLDKLPEAQRGPILVARKEVNTLLTTLIED